MKVEIDGKEVDTGSLVVDGIMWDDHPDYCDAYFADGCFVDGSSLTDDQLSQLAYDNWELLHDLVTQRAY